jgi:hypothetical protein
MNNSGIDNCLDRGFEVIDHVEADIIQMRVVDV